MHHVQELSAKEAARILGVPVGTVKARLHRARSRLARHVRSILVCRRRPVTVKNGCSAALIDPSLGCMRTSRTGGIDWLSTDCAVISRLKLHRTISVKGMER